MKEKFIKIQECFKRFKCWVVKFLNKKSFFLFFLLIFFTSIIVILFSLFCLFNLSNEQKEKNDQFLTFLTTGISLFIMSLSSLLSLKASESSDRRDRDHLILETFKQNYLILQKNEYLINEYVEEINKIGKKEWIGLYKLIDYLNNEYIPSTRHQNQIKDLDVNNNSYKLIKNFLLHEKKNRTQLIAHFYLRYHRENIYNEIKNEDWEIQFSKQSQSTNKLISETAFFIHLDQKFNEFFSVKNHKYRDYKENISHNINSKYSNINYFFRHTHRIFKLLNEIDERDTKRNYLGILRAQYSEQVIVSIYFNAVFTDKGTGLARQLLKNDFFASDQDFQNGEQMIHGAFESTFREKKHYEIIEELFVSKVKNNSKLGYWKESRQKGKIILPDYFEKIFNN